MKKLFLLLIGITIFTSCEFKEEIAFNKDGSGEFRLSADMGEFIKQFNQMSKKEDSLKKPEKTDTVYNFVDFLKKDKEALEKLQKEDKEFYEALKDVSVQLHVDEKKGEMNFAYVYPFKKIKDLEYLMNKFDQVEKLKNNNTKDDMFNDIPATQVSFSLKKHKFQRKAKLINPEKPAESSDENNEFYKVMRYKLIYHFPYKIDSVDFEGAQISADRKTLIIETDMETLIKNPELLNFEVTFD